jgi:UDP-glucose 4-epimerase
VEKKRVLVTGGAGFIGSELVHQLAKQKVRVTAVDSLVNGKRENLDGVLGPDVDLVVADIRNVSVITPLLRGTDVLFHLAGLGGRHSIQAPVENHEVNASATLSLLEKAREMGVKRFVYVSSSEVYGTTRTAPITEEHPTLPMTVYGASKLAGECYTRAFWQTYRYPTVVVRPFDAYGPRSHHEGDSEEVIPKFMLRCLLGEPMMVFGDGRQTRDFTFVSDTARGILAAGFSEATVGETFNLGGGKEIRIQDLAITIADVLGKKGAAITHVESRPGDVLRLIADSSKASKLLDFEPTVSLKDGLTQLRDWYTSQGRSPLEFLENKVGRKWKPQGVASHV